MTCIAGMLDKKNNNVVMGADTCGSDGDYKVSRLDTKIFMNGDFLIGCTSSFRMIQILRYKFKPPEINDKDIYEYLCTDFVDELQKFFKASGFLQELSTKELRGGNFLVAYKNRLFEIESDFQVGENSCGYYAIGSGFKFAYGCLYAVEDMNMNVSDKVLLSLEAAAKFSTTVQSPFIIMNSSGDTYD